jgi:ribosomal-protein-alanine N-acetyltransferase
MSTPTPDLRYVSLLWAVPKHAAPIARLHASLFPKAWDVADINGLLANPGSIGLVAATAAPFTIGGFALAQVAADEAEILSIGVGGTWQRHGIGRRLVEGLMRAGAKAGARCIFLDVAPSNAAAVALYGKLGFAEAGRRKAYYTHADGSREDALQLAATLA